MSELQDAKVGDVFVLNASQYGNLDYRKVQIKKATKSHLVVTISNVNYRFWRKNGREVGAVSSRGFYRSKSLHPLTEELERRVRECSRDRLRLHLAKRLERAAHEATLEQLRRIEAILDESVGGEPS